MTIENGANQIARRHTLYPWITRRRVFMMAGIMVVSLGLFLNWNWLTAIGAAPILLSLAPCLIMCALGLCMRRGDGETK